MNEIKQARAAIARWVMGWHEGTDYDYAAMCKFKAYRKPDNSLAGYTPISWRPDEKIDQSLQLAERLRELGHSYQITAYSEDANTAYQNQHCFMLKDEPSMFEWADTLEQAIYAVALQIAERMEKEAEIVLPAVFGEDQPEIESVKAFGESFEGLVQHGEKEEKS